MKFLVTITIFLIINFGALGIGSYLMGNGPQTEWYLGLNKAPWTPPGWVFGAAWTAIMICFSVYMAELYTVDKSTQVIVLFLVQVLLNIGWNFMFFNQHQVGIGLIIITLLSLLMLYFLVAFHSQLNLMSLLVAPYILWLFIATSLNFYVYAYN
ncbi:tryptophan-rich sensory protein [Xanthomarina sp. F1114]|uniref:TspO/MBR family protein n=1 Tax=Xanthomarina sp. F1114 TaxID=2996019 RepID=UPI00225E4B66|nr:TspO/MBR family protein [Xanthomarina sp. F1114]MCX7546940.1 tryptophan-rich sensory protein [Xanthomarina sp. F1114]